MGGVWFSKFENFRTEFLIFEELENIGERERERLLGGNENRESWKYSLLVGICVM